MKRLHGTVLASLLVAGSAALGHAQDGAVDRAAADAFDARLFAAAPGNAPGKKAYACFVRHYDADHLARHPKQKVSAMQLLVTAEIPSDEKALSYSFRLGVNYRQRPGDFDSSGYCNHATAADTGKEIRFDCGVDCEGGGISIALSKDNKSAIIRLERITLAAQQAGRRGRRRASGRRRRQDIPARPRGHARLRRAGHQPQGTRRDQT